ncbi:outer membrane beta-barrel protein [Aliamphritea spongicola]|nr:outer membrane beta-barrel protein [Aliamphritea spongicola]
MVTRDISLLARTGVLFWDVDTKSLSGNKSSTDGTDWYLSVGAAYHFTEQLAVDWQFSRYALENKDNDKLDIDTVTLGLTYSF